MPPALAILGLMVLEWILFLLLLLLKIQTISNDHRITYMPAFCFFYPQAKTALKREGNY